MFVLMPILVRKARERDTCGFMYEQALRSETQKNLAQRQRSPQVVRTREAAGYLYSEMEARKVRGDEVCLACHASETHYANGVDV